MKSHGILFNHPTDQKQARAPKETANPILLSLLVFLQDSMGHVSELSSHTTPLQLPDQDKSHRGAYEDRLEAGPSVTDFCAHDRATTMVLLAVCDHPD